MDSIKLIVGTVNSFPLGYTQEQIEELYAMHLRPVLKVLYAHPKIQASFYFSGIMLEWLENHHSEYISAMSDMFQQRRLELLGGGFYDPIFPIIPRQDRIGQIEHLTTLIRRLFGKKPRGAWLSNFFWEPDMPSYLKTAGMEYTFLDDTFFMRAGMESRDLHYPAITEDQGKTMVVFPVSGQGRKMFWRSDPREVVDYICRQADSSGERVIVMAYDCAISARSEVPEDQAKMAWLDAFFQLVEEQQVAGIIETVQPSRLFKRPGYMTRAYFEAPTLEEVHAAVVGETPPPSPESMVLLPGINRLGYFAQKNVRHSLARYPEANLLYAKMQYIASLVSLVRGDKYKKQAARESLWKAQNHASYWHGADGGLYRNRYRKAAYSSMIEAEKQTRERGIFAPSFVRIDYDFDGVDEILYQANELNAYIHLRGGVLFELDNNQYPWNYADTCSRHPEMYHLDAHESEGYDSYSRHMFVDHFLTPDTQLASFACGDYQELLLCTMENYEVEDVRREGFSVVLSARGTMEHQDLVSAMLLRKTYTFQKQHIKVAYAIHNESPHPVSFVFSPELNLGFASKAIADLRVYARETRSRSVEIGPEVHTVGPITELVFHDVHACVGISLTSSLPCQWWSFPLETNVKTSEGFIREYQASCVMPRYEITLEPGQQFDVLVGLSFSKLQD